MSFRMLLLSGASSFAIPRSILSKLYSWHEFEDDRLDSWGCWPLVLEVTGTFDDSVDYGSALTDRCILSSKSRCQDNYPALTQDDSYFIGCLRSTDTFNPLNFTASLSTSASGAAISLVQSATGYRVSRGVTGTTDDADVSAVTDEWTLSIAQYRGVGEIAHHQNGDFNLATTTVSSDVPTGSLGLGSPGGGGTVSYPAIAAVFSGRGDFTAEELYYLYNGGSFRTLSEIISDSGLTVPACTMTRSYPFGTQMATGYMGNLIGHDAGATVTQGVFSTTGHSSGKYWAALRVHKTLSGSQGSNLYVSNAAGTVYGGLPFDLGHGTVFAAGMTAGSNPGNPIAQADDWIMIAVDHTAGKIWFGLNGTWYGDPVAGTGAAVTFSGSPTLYLAVDSTSDLFSGKMTYTADDMPYTSPTGFTPWGD